MANAIERFFGKVFSTIITYTVGLVLPWWIVDFIASGGGAIESYQDLSFKYKKLHRYTYGLILPWWTLALLASKPDNSEYEESTDALEASTPGSIQASEAEKGPKEKNYYCPQCGLHVVDTKSPIGKHGKCPEKPASNWAHKWTDMGYVGTFKSACQLCGITIDHQQQTVFSMKCLNGTQHNWKRA